MPPTVVHFCISVLDRVVYLLGDPTDELTNSFSPSFEPLVFVENVSTATPTPPARDLATLKFTIHAQAPYMWGRFKHRRAEVSHRGWGGEKRFNPRRNNGVCWRSRGSGCSFLYIFCTWYGRVSSWGLLLRENIWSWEGARRFRVQGSNCHIFLHFETLKGSNLLVWHKIPVRARFESWFRGLSVFFSQCIPNSQIFGFSGSKFPPETRESSVLEFPLSSCA